MRVGVGQKVTVRRPSQAPSGPVIVVRDVSKAFELPGERRTTVKHRLLNPFPEGCSRRLQALANVELDVREGEFFAIVGRNGSGKSTLLRCLCGIYPVDSGSIEISGRAAPFIELGVGFNAELSARDNLATNAVILGLPPREARARVDEMLAFAELEEFADQKLKNLSTGMGVRLAFACATHVDADIFLFDEVLAVGDAQFRQKCFAHFDRLRAAGKTIVLVTHDMHSVRALSDRAALLDAGRVVDVGDPTSIAERYEDMNALARHLPVGERREHESAATRQPLPLLGADPRRLPTLVRTLAATEFKLKYLDAKLSYLWAVARPLARFGAMLLIFSHLGRFNAGVRHYPVYLLLSLVLWTFFSQVTESSVRSLTRGAEFLRKLPFPPIAIPITTVVGGLIDLAANLVPVLVFAFAFGVYPQVGWLEFIPLAVLLTAFSTGLALFLSAAFVRYRDLDQVWMVVVQTMFFVTPIFYVASSLPRTLARLFVLVNPVATIVTQARHAIVDPGAPTAASVAGGMVFLLVPLAIVVAVSLAGVLVFKRESAAAAELV